MKYELKYLPAAIGNIKAIVNDDRKLVKIHRILHAKRDLTKMMQ